MTVNKFQKPHRTVPVWSTQVSYWSLQGHAATKQCYFSYDFLVIVIVIVTHFLSFYGRTLSDASMLYFANFFGYLFFYSRLSWPNG